MPGGDSEGNDFLNEAKRELEEETGYTSNRWRAWFDSDILYYGKMEWNNHFFIAKNCEQKGVKHLDPGEKIEVNLVTFEEFIILTQRDDFRNAEIRRKVRSVLEDQNSEQKLKDFYDEVFL